MQLVKILVCRFYIVKKTTYNSENYGKQFFFSLTIYLDQLDRNQRVYVQMQGGYDTNL